ncbi:threonine synthase [Rhodoligotrophos appendicifer]|uniref:threonine synthase n=1 Tax=Rhodoligotrophos appendicifer TaxID=987056 RepID=UPI001184E2FE|nr:threonine synthase [Rhodoligotrophos appendicifer]
MRYISTRGKAPEIGFAEVVTTGLAPDMGLYVPKDWPRFSEPQLSQLSGKSYQDIAFSVLQPFIGDDLSSGELKGCIERAYANFGHEAVAPLVQIGSRAWLLELFHGPTLAFKDVAMRLLSQLMDTINKRTARRVTIIGATSGDTGSAAIDAFRGSATVDIFILYPHGRISEIQRRQMTSVADSNVYTLAVEGTFDDCQALVKAMFADCHFNETLNLAGVNSINWARIIAQSVYYFTSALALGAPTRAVSYCVPTGNFGNIFAGYVAKCMGLPIRDLLVATNSNNILDRALQSGEYKIRGVHHTISPSMDIEISSNFERLLFEYYGRDPEKILSCMGGLRDHGSFSIDHEVLCSIRKEFASHAATEAETRAVIQLMLEKTGLLIDPHTAVGLAAAATLPSDDATPIITLATAHPAKFPDAVEDATGARPSLPERLADLLGRPERVVTFSRNLSDIQKYIAQNSRIKVSL